MCVRGVDQDRKHRVARRRRQDLVEFDAVFQALAQPAGRHQLLSAVDVLLKRAEVLLGGADAGESDYHVLDQEARLGQIVEREAAKIDQNPGGTDGRTGSPP